MQAQVYFNPAVRDSAGCFSQTSWGVEAGEAISGNGVKYLLQKVSEWPHGASCAERFFYLLLANNILPGLERYPVCDVCLFLANALAGLAPDKAEVYVADWRFLPIVPLLACLGRKIVLPEAGLKNNHAVLLKELFNICPGQGIVRAGTYEEAAIALDFFPGHKFSQWEDDSLPCFRGLLVGRVDALGNARFASLREKLVQSGQLRAVLELPGADFRSQMKLNSPLFVMCLEPGAGRSLVRVGRLQQEKVGEGCIDQHEALHLFLGNKKNEHVMDLSADILCAEKICNLSLSAAKLALFRNPGKKLLRLGDLAQILRCQWPRKRLKDQEGCQKAAALPPIGFCPDGSFIAREVNQQDLDPLTGILLPNRGGLVRLARGGPAAAGKFFLRQKDIIFAFRGTENGIGASGFVQSEGLPAICSRHMYIIRARPGVSAVWLYYMLKSDAVRSQVRGFAAGVPQLAINVDTLRQLAIEAPCQDEVERLESAHASLAEDLELIDTIHARMGLTLESMGLPGQNAQRDLSGNGRYRSPGSA